VRMELDRVDAMPAAIMRAQARTVAMRVERQRQQLAAGQRAVTGDGLGEGAAAFALQRLAQRQVIAPEVARRELRRLVVDDVGGRSAHPALLLSSALAAACASASTKASSSAIRPNRPCWVPLSTRSICVPPSGRRPAGRSAR